MSIMNLKTYIVLVIYVKKIILILFILISVGIINIEGTETLSLTSDAKSAILMEMTTKQVIYENNADEIRAPASMTKIMTMLLVLEAIENEVISLDTIVSTSEIAAGMGGSQVFLEVGEQMTVQELFKCVCIVSANDAAVALAEQVGGSLDNFVKMMNEKAQEIGMKNTTFKNCNGLPESGHTSTARDIGLLSCYILDHYQDQVLQYTNIYEDYIRKGTDKQTWLVNTNKLVKFVNEVDGLKTGWTEEAGYCLSATMKKNDIRFIAVTMGNSSAKERNIEIMQMLNYASNNYELVTVLKKDDIVKTIKSIKTSPNVYNIYIENDVNILKKKSEKMGNVTKEVDITFSEDNLNGEVGTIKVYLDNQLVGEGNLLILEELRRKNFMEMLLETLKGILISS